MGTPVARRLFRFWGTKKPAACETAGEADVGSVGYLLRPLRSLMVTAQ